MDEFDPGWSGWVLTIITICFFQLLSKISVHVFSIPPGVIRGYDDEYRKFRYRNLTISFSHAVITGCWSLICVVLYGKLMREDMVAFVNWPTYGLCCFTTGYFLYDVMDIVMAKRIMEKWDILLHHMTILISASYVVTYASCVGYQAFGMLVELNTIFLHRRQMFQLAGIDRADPLVRRNTFFNLTTFIIFRCFPLAYLTVGIFYDGHRVPIWYLSFYGSCMALLNVINAILLYRLFQADVVYTNGNGKKNPHGHKKVKSIVGFCDGLNMTRSDYVTPSSSKSADGMEMDGKGSRVITSRSHFNSNVLKDVTQMNEGVRRTLTLTP